MRRSPTDRLPGDTPEDLGELLAEPAGIPGNNTIVVQEYHRTPNAATVGIDVDRYHIDATGSTTKGDAASA